MSAKSFGVVLIMIAAPAGDASAATRRVSVDGDDACDGVRCPTRTIGAAIAAAASGDEIRVGPGRFTENVVVDRPVTLRGAGEHRTTLVPALSAPEPCTTSSLCGGAASSVILIRASGVTITRLTVDGDNPELSSGAVAGGADLDARNGIIEDHLAGTFDGTRVESATVVNVFLRGIQVGSGGSGFVIEGSTVRNVRATAASVAIFNFGGAGLIAGNRVEDANDAISANWSRGTRFEGNHVTRSRSGVHTDNSGGSGGEGDVIEGNTVGACAEDGYGVWVFVPYVPATVRGNHVGGCAVGLAVLGGQPGPVASRFEDNRVEGDGGAGSVGVLVTSETFGWGTMDAAADLVDTRVSGFEVGVAVQRLDRTATVTWTGGAITDSAVGLDVDGAVEVAGACLAGDGTALVLTGGSLGVHGSDIVDAGALAVDNRAAPVVVDATGNFWGDRDGPAAGSLSGPVLHEPFLEHRVACP
jgi:hypothetical protein